MSRRVLITGSSRGIGAAIARQLAADDWEVALHYTQSRDAVQALARELGGAKVYRADLSRPKEANGLIDQVWQDGPLDALVNNAGIYRPHSFGGVTDAEFEATLANTFEINLYSPLRLTRAFLRKAEKQGRGRVLNVASRVGFRGEPGAALYAASKAGLINVTRSLAVEYAAKGFQFFGIAPGWVETSMSRDGMEDRLPEILSTLPLGRMATPEDCAASAAFLLSDGASYLSGVVIDINGASYFH